MVAVQDKISCGIAGWSYKDWDGYVYPPGVKDKLRFVAEYVDMVEINSTFYRPPDSKTAASWVARTSDIPDFFFTAKLHQDVTHRGKIERETVSAFRNGLEPLVSAGKLRHLLAQFRYDFADTPGSRHHLERIESQFGELTNLTLELRHNSWQSPSAMEFLTELGTTVANIDYPLARNSFNLRKCTVGKHAYLRLHGRNTKAWFDKKAGRDQTYNYYYSGMELEDIAERALELAEEANSLTLVANNHYQGKEVANSLQLKALATGKKVRVPEQLAEKYPDLKNISRGDG